jgi:formylglycine-generating enzyme required for sulfatase activity
VLPDGRLASGGGDGTIKLWDPASGQLTATLKGHSASVSALAVLPDGRLASGARLGTIKLWDPASGQLQATLEGHSASVKTLAVLPDGRLASGAFDNTIKLWDPATGQLQATLEGHSGYVFALAVLPDKRLASGAGDGTIKLWNGNLKATTEPLTLIEIPAGSFLMGSPPDEPERLDDEGPQHKVKLESFFISQTPITQAQWRAVAAWQPLPAERWGRNLNPDPSHFQNREGQAVGEVRLFEAEANTDNRPVEKVSWLDAMEFCSRLSQRTGRTYTLPSEAQWEYACRAGTTTPFHFGDMISPELANYDGNYVYGNGPTGIYREQTTPVGLFPANAWGLQDMHGNVWEWCLDEWHESYEGAPTDGRAWVDVLEVEKSKESEKRRLLRGGSWDSIPRNCRSAYRSHFRPDDALYVVGFRVVCLPQGPSLNH